MQNVIACPPNTIVFKSGEGSTGDEGPYKGTVKSNYSSYDFSRGDVRWVQLKKDAWYHLDGLYKPKNPPVHLLVNCDPTDPENANDYLKDSVNHVWRKVNNAGHGYQLNDEVQTKINYDTLVNNTITSIDSSTKVRCRDEMDQFKTNLFLQAPKWNIYWTALSALHFGLDIWPNNVTGIQDTFTNKTAFDFFNRYAGQKSALYSPAAFCALRDGLDAGNTTRFSTQPPSLGGFGPGTSALGESDGKARCARIADAFAARGAKQQDRVHSQGGSQNQTESDSLNDVGWGIFQGNYERYITQYDPNGTSVGWWRVGGITQPYGRFARGFNRTDKTTMYFDINDDFVSSCPGSPTMGIRSKFTYGIMILVMEHGN